MLVADELRLGNFLQGLNGFVVQVCKIEKEKVYVEGDDLQERVASNYNYVKPIKLTPGLLLQSGFSVMKSDDEYPIFVHAKLSPNMYIEYNLLTTYSFCIASDDGQFVDIIRSFQFVHELQNLFLR